MIRPMLRASALDRRQDEPAAASSDERFSLGHHTSRPRAYVFSTSENGGLVGP